MRKVLATVQMSLDGVMQAPGGPEEDPTGGFKHGGWTVNYWDDTTMNAMGGVFGQPYELLLGRKTYDIFAGYWPYQKDDPFAESLNKVRKYVVTSSRAPLEVEELSRDSRCGERHCAAEARRRPDAHDPGQQPVSCRLC